MTSPQQYTPRNITALDALLSARRVADQILRNNPLTNAVVSTGLMKWTGNHVKTVGPNKVDFLWIGDFFPADTTLGGIAQKGIVMYRDDSTGGTISFAIYDHDPGGDSLGLRQTIHLSSGDGDPLLTEARHGGQQWPESNIAMGVVSQEITDWARTPVTPTGAFVTLAEGRVNVVGNHLIGRYWAATLSGATGEFRIRVEGFAGDIIGPLRSLGVSSNTVFEDQLDVSSERGETRTVRLEARTSNTTGFAYVAPVSFRCYTNAA